MSSEPAPMTTPAPRAARRFFYGWWVVIAGMMANFAYSIQFNSSFGVFIRPMVDDLGWTRSQLSGAQTLGSIPQAITVSLLGPLVDRHGSRWLVGVGGILVGFSFLALATITEVWQLYLYRGIVTSIGAVCLGAFLGVTISNWFLIRRGQCHPDAGQYPPAAVERR
jgi:MFS transporter, OFA family, oxalate/formate antiporter